MRSPNTQKRRQTIGVVSFSGFFCYIDNVNLLAVDGEFLM